MLDLPTTQRPPAVGPAASGLQAVGEEGLYLSRLRESVDLVLGEEGLAVEAYVEDAATALHQLRSLVESLFDDGRQTGGAGLVVSSYAVFDLDSGHR